MSEEIIPCSTEHVWGGRRMVDLLDPNKHEPQHPELWGVPCDCGRIKIAGENDCGCLVKVWEFQVVDN